MSMTPRPFLDVFFCRLRLLDDESRLFVATCSESSVNGSSSSGDLPENSQQIQFKPEHINPSIHNNAGLRNRACFLKKQKKLVKRFLQTWQQNCSIISL